MALRFAVYSKPGSISCSNKILRSGINNFVTSSSSYINAETKEAKRKPEAKGKILVDGIRLYWEKHGNGPHVALLLPGLVGSIDDNYAPVIKKMNLEKYTLIGWDPPGYGKSRPPNREVFTEEFMLRTDAKLAHSLMKELGYNKFSTVGWSNGGITGGFIAAKFPESVHKVVMCNCPLQCDNRSVNIMKIMVDLNNWTPPQRKALLRTYGKTYAQKMLSDWLKINEKYCGCPKFHNLLSSEVRSIRAPTLYIKSVGDISCTIEEVVELVKFMPNFKLHEVPKGGHDHLEFLDEFVAATETFLS